MASKSSAVSAIQPGPTFADMGQKARMFWQQPLDIERRKAQATRVTAIAAARWQCPPKTRAKARR